MAKVGTIEMEGTVIETLARGNYTVRLDQGHTILAHPCGKMRKHSIRIVDGDRVKVELSPYDLTKGRIVYRYR